MLFPGVVLPITVGRDKSIKAVNDAYKTDKLVGVLAQKDSSIEDPGILDLEKIGTVARIIKQIKMPDGGTTVIIQGRKRFAVREFTREDPYFKAAITLSLEDADAARKTSNSKPPSRLDRGPGGTDSSSFLPTCLRKQRSS